MTVMVMKDLPWDEIPLRATREYKLPEDLCASSYFGGDRLVPAV
jgi:hypothetical protein